MTAAAGACARTSHITRHSLRARVSQKERHCTAACAALFLTTRHPLCAKRSTRTQGGYRKIRFALARAPAPSAARRPPKPAATPPPPVVRSPCARSPARPRLHHAANETCASKACSRGSPSRHARLPYSPPFSTRFGFLNWHLEKEGDQYLYLCLLRFVDLAKSEGKGASTTCICVG